MTGDPLRVLHLEADADAHELVRRRAATTGLTFRFERASGREDFEAALKKGHLDLVLADSAITGFGGAEPFHSVHEHLPGVPYIAVTGPIGEERAAELSRLGARDVIRKDRLERLPEAILAASKAKPAAPYSTEAEERFHDIAENLKDVFWIRTQGAGKFLYVSPSYKSVWGRTADVVLASPEAWPEAFLLEDTEAVREARGHLEKGEAYEVEYRIHRPDGSIHWIHDRGFPVSGSSGPARMLGIAADISERKRLEGELLQAQKMELVGKLAAGIAHDFNNLLTIISGYVSMLLDKEGMPPGTTEPLKRVFTASRQATALVRQLLLFSRKRAPKREVVDLNIETEIVSGMVQRVLGEMIVVSFESAPASLRVNADVAMLEQALLNLAVNARDAMPRGGRLSITTGLAAKGSKPQQDGVAARGEYAWVAVRDTGAGIPAPILPRIFEPFFTTKDEGRGTGLGLATVKDIAKRHDGWIDVETTVGVGSVFKIYLPLTKAEVAAPAEADPKPAGKAGKGTILLVEDETNVREFAAAVLQQDGYNLLQAKSAENAVEVWRWHSARIDLLVTDVVLPGEMSGLQLGEKLQKEKPSLRVILATGYGREAVIPAGKGGKPPYVLTKPYTPKALLQAIHEVTA